MNDLFEKAITDIEAEAIAWWEHLHAHPELSMKEYETSAFLREMIKTRAKLDDLKRVGETGLLVEIHGDKAESGKVLALRADMDALPIQEVNELPFCSKYPGVMHACGHDVHTAILLAVLVLLSEHRDQFSGTLRFFFQPAEETQGGAQLFRDDPEVRFDDIDGFVALHVTPDFYLGSIGTRAGTLSASADAFRLVVKGRQCHGAHPQLGIDAIVAAAQIVSAAQSIVSRNVSALDSAVISFGAIHGGTANNIIADEVVLDGTIRATCPDTRMLLRQRLQETAEGIAAALGAEARLNVSDQTPAVICDKEWAERVFRVGDKLLGAANVHRIPQASMGGEDFSILKGDIPGAFFRLGVRSPGREYSPGHAPDFYTDPGCIKVGIRCMIGIALDYLEG